MQRDLDVLVLAGQVHTQAEWDEAGGSPGNGVYCGSDCHCSLVETDEPEHGSLNDAPVSADDGVENADRGGVDRMQNNWSDAARAASLAVRQAKAVLRAGGDVDRDGAEDLSEEAREAIRAAVRKRMMAAGR